MGGISSAMLSLIAITTAGELETPMATLIVRNLDPGIVQALKRRAAEHGRSAEAEHRALLEAALLRPPRKSLAEVLAAMPDVGEDEDFERWEDPPPDDDVPR